MGRGTIYPFVLEHLRRHVRSNSVVLETGCGAAKYRSPIEETGATYIGCDVPNAHYQELGDVDLFCSSEALPFASSSVSLMFNQGAIDYMPNWPETLKEAHRVLKPGGRLLIYTYNYETLVDINRNCMASNRPWERHHRAFRPEALLDALATAGFVARDVSAELDTWSPETRWLRLVYRVTGRLASERAARSIWRAYEGRRPR